MIDMETALLKKELADKDEELEKGNKWISACFCRPYAPIFRNQNPELRWDTSFECLHGMGKDDM